MVTNADKRWSLTGGSKYSDLTWEAFGILENWLLTRGGRLREVVATGGLTVLSLIHVLYIKWENSLDL